MRMSSRPLASSDRTIMNILWIYSRPMNPEQGGTERMSYLIHNGLATRGYNCLGQMVITPDGTISHNGAIITELYQYLTHLRVDVVINQMVMERWLLETFLARGGQQWLNEGKKLISCLHFDPQPVPLSHLYRCSKNKRFIDWITYLKVSILSPLYNRKSDRQQGTLMRYMYQHSSALICLSDTHFPYLKRVMNLDNYDKMHAINNPLTFPDIANPDILQEKQHIVLVVARMSEYDKRISIMLKAWRTLMADPALGDWHFYLLGEGPSLNDYELYINRHHIPNVHFEGQQSPEPYYRRASLLLCTSMREGWGLTLTEAFQRACVPVVMNSSPVFSTIVNHGKDGILTPNNDLNAYIQALRQIMTQSEELQLMQLNALESAHRFTIDHALDQWELLLQS